MKPKKPKLKELKEYDATLTISFIIEAADDDDAQTKAEEALDSLNVGHVTNAQEGAEIDATADVVERESNV